VNDRLLRTKGCLVAKVLGERIKRELAKKLALLGGRQVSNSVWGAVTGVERGGSWGPLRAEIEERSKNREGRG